MICPYCHHDIEEPVEYESDIVKVRGEKFIASHTERLSPSKTVGLSHTLYVPVLFVERKVAEERSKPTTESLARQP